MYKDTKIMETRTAPVGTVRRFVSEQFLTDYKTNTLDSAYAPKTSATTSRAGIVQLNDAVNSTSTTQAATANAVKKAYDLANGKANASHGNHVPSTQTADARKFLRNDNTWQTLPSATTSATGIVQLNDAVNSTSTTQAATANAVKKAYDLANGKANASHGNHVPTTETANARKFLRNDNTWQTLPSATTSATGIVQLSDAVNSTSTTLAATANAVKKAYDLASKSANINDSTTATNSVWSSSKTQTQINTSYNTMNNRVEALEESMYVEFVSKRGDTINGDLTIKKSDGAVSRINVHRTLNSNDMQGSLDIFAHDGGSVSLSTNNKTSGKQTSSYVFGGDAFWSPRNADGIVPDIGTPSYRFKNAWLTQLEVSGDANITSRIVLNNQRISADTNSVLFTSSSGSTYHPITTRWVNIGEYGGVTKRLVIGSSVPFSPTTGDIWIQI